MLIEPRADRVVVRKRARVNCGTCRPSGKETRAVVPSSDPRGVPASPSTCFSPGKRREHRLSLPATPSARVKHSTLSTLRISSAAGSLLPQHLWLLASGANLRKGICEIGRFDRPCRVVITASREPTLTSPLSLFPAHHERRSPPPRRPF